MLQFSCFRINSKGFVWKTISAAHKKEAKVDLRLILGLNQKAEATKLVTIFIKY